MMQVNLRFAPSLVPGRRSRTTSCERHAVGVEEVGVAEIDREGAALALFHRARRLRAIPPPTRFELERATEFHPRSPVADGEHLLGTDRCVIPLRQNQPWRREQNA